MTQPLRPPLDTLIMSRPHRITEQLPIVVLTEEDLLSQAYCAPTQEERLEAWRELEEAWARAARSQPT